MSAEYSSESSRRAQLERIKFEVTKELEELQQDNRELAEAQAALAEDHKGALK